MMYKSIFREQSSDSGVASFDSYADQYDNNYQRRSSRYRPRNLHMVMKGRNYFEVRDLDDSLSDDAIVPLALPKLPSAFETTSSTQSNLVAGLIRSSDLNQISPNYDENEEFLREEHKSEIESIEEGMEEIKVSRDKSVSEKRLRDSFKGDSVNVSPASSRISWDQTGGETMAVKECSSLSLSSSDESRQGPTEHKSYSVDDDISAVTITPGNVLCKYFVYIHKNKIHIYFRISGDIKLNPIKLSL